MTSEILSNLNTYANFFTIIKMLTHFIYIVKHGICNRYQIRGVFILSHNGISGNTM